MMRTALLVLLLSQDERAAEVRRLFEQLKDDSIETRARAVDGLVRLGAAILPSIGEAEVTASGEFKSRLGEVRRLIGERARFLSLYPPPSLVSVEARNRPVRAVLEEVRRQGRTPIEDAKVAEEERVSVSFKGVPFWKAIDEVCRAHGDLQYSVDGETVVVRQGKYVAKPLLFSGPFAVFLVVWSKQGDRWDQFQLRLCWEKGTRPGGIHYDLHEQKGVDRIDLEGMRQDGGTAYLPQVQAGSISQVLTLDLRGVPFDEPARLERVKAAIRCRFILSTTGVTFDDPLVGAGKKGDCGKVAVDLGDCKREGERFDIRFSLKPGEIETEVLELLEVTAKDASGKVHPIGTLAPHFRQPFRQMGVGMSSPQGIPGIKSLSITVPDRVHLERLTVPLSAILEALK